MIVTVGENIYSTEVENVLYMLPKTDSGKRYKKALQAPYGKNNVKKLLADTLSLSLFGKGYHHLIKPKIQ